VCVLPLLGESQSCRSARVDRRVEVQFRCQLSLQVLPSEPYRVQVGRVWGEEDGEEEYVQVPAHTADELALFIIALSTTTSSGLSVGCSRRTRITFGVIYNYAGRYRY
jgi:hypothetical protein